MTLEQKQVFIAKFNLLEEDKNIHTLALFCKRETRGRKDGAKKLYKNLLKYYTKEQLLNPFFSQGLSYRLDKEVSKSSIINIFANKEFLL